MSERENDMTPDDALSAQPEWLVKIRKQVPDIGVFPHCKLGEGFAPYAIGSNTGCILICPIGKGIDVDESALNLEKAKMNLMADEPYSEQILVFMVDKGCQIDEALYESRKIHCMSAERLIDFAVEYFSENREQIRLGVIAYSQGHYKMSSSLLMNADEVNDPDAQFVIAQMYAKGRGVSCDQKIAEEWYWRAARQGHHGAAIELEKMLGEQEVAIRRREDEIVSEIEEFARKLLAKKGIE